ncbi:GNAT family N-acetyltransferase [Deinococcus yunweiensis]|uniref:GNAT family N-acetyltransferase n=1 Tax=Deinococcus yunweiensis TaxID=367282 RepID=UPI00398F0289
MPVHLRAFTPRDLAALRGFHGHDQMAPVVDRVLTDEEDAPGDDALQRVVAEVGGEAVGYGYVARSAWHPEGSVQGEVVVPQAFRGKGVGSALAARLMTHAAHLDATSLTTWVSGREPAFERFAVRRGFEVVQRFVTMTLNVAASGDLETEHAIGRAQQRGVSLFTFEDMGRTLEARQKLYDLNRRLAPLLPGNGEEFPTFEEYGREILDAEWFRPEGQLIAAEGERWVGLAGLGFYEDGQRLHHEFTAVDPAFQGRGIALALKAWSLQLARAWGVREIRTGNDASNTAIIALNCRLGYHLEPGVVKLRRTLRPDWPDPGYSAP